MRDILALSLAIQIARNQSDRSLGLRRSKC
jgi:hypothetical protein